MEKREWKLCLDCKKAIYDKEDDPCFLCGGSDSQIITESQIKEMIKNRESGIAVKTRYWGGLC